MFNHNAGFDVLARNVEVDILVNDKPIKKYTHGGKVYIESKHSAEYTIRIKNNHFHRKLFVISVDGINVIDGKAAGASKMGYIINGYNSTTIKGFRVSNETVHAFVFSSKEDSYAAKSEETGGDTSNAGVIGVEVYHEKFSNPFYQYGQFIGNYTTDYTVPKTPVDRDIMRRVTPKPTWEGPTVLGTSSSGPAYSSLSMSSETKGAIMNLAYPIGASETPVGFDMGTEFSDKEVHDKVVDIEFEVGSKDQTISIFYASKGGLTSLGVPMVKQAQIASPNPFPNTFCKPPKR